MLEKIILAVVTRLGSYLIGLLTDYVEQLARDTKHAKKVKEAMANEDRRKASADLESLFND